MTTWSILFSDFFQEYTGKHVFSRIFRNVPDTYSIERSSSTSMMDASSRTVISIFLLKQKEEKKASLGLL